MKYTIGIDIGGTHTDAVLIDEMQRILYKVKTSTTRPIDKGFREALRILMENVSWKEIRAVFVGTTHATNALLEKKDLYKVGVLRITGYELPIAPCAFWPEDVKETLCAGYCTIPGGYECDGRALYPFKEDQAKNAIENLIAQGAESLAIIGTFSPLFPEQEKITGEIAQSYGLPVSLSHALGSVGLIERENSTILNAALKKALAHGFSALQEACQAPLFLTQNNGTILDLKKAMDCPILTLSAGPTNSFYGAAKLSGYDHAVIVDIGGTSTDIGLIKKGFPRRSLGRSSIGGIPLNFSMPDVFSIALGGGSYVDLEKGSVGPLSAARNLKREALSFGGKHLTFTDLAAALFPHLIPEAKQPCLPKDKALELMRSALHKIKEGAELMANADKVPILLVGGGAKLFQELIDEIGCIIPNNADVANAYGAALAEISGTEERIVCLAERDKVLEEMQASCFEKACSNGADPDKTRLIDLHILPYHYVPGHLARILVTAAGPMKLYTQNN